MIYLFSNIPEEKHITPTRGDVLVFLNKAENFQFYKNFPGKKLLFRRMDKENYGSPLPGVENWVVFGSGPNSIPPEFVKDLKAGYSWDYQVGKGEVKSMTTGYTVAEFLRSRFPKEDICLVNFGYELQQSTYRCPWHNWRFEAERLKSYKHIFTAPHVEEKADEKPSLLYEIRGWLGDKVAATAVLANAAAAGIRVNIFTNTPEIWEDCPFLDKSVTRENASHILRHGFAIAWTRDAPHVIESATMHLANNMNIDIPCRAIRPFVWGKIPKGRLLPEKYVVINTGYQNSAPAKKWHSRFWLKLAEKFPEITFVQMGQKKNHAQPLTGKNIRSMIDQTNTIELFQLIRDAECVISPPSACIHIAGSWKKPAVILAGGREPGQMTRYEGMYSLDRIGQLPCCKGKGCHMNKFEPGAGKGACRNYIVLDGEEVGCCMAGITPEMVAEKLEKILKNEEAK